MWVRWVLYAIVRHRQPPPPDRPGSVRSLNYRYRLRFESKFRVHRCNERPGELKHCSPEHIYAMKGLLSVFRSVTTWNFSTAARRCVDTCFACLGPHKQMRNPTSNVRFACSAFISPPRISVFPFGTHDAATIKSFSAPVCFLPACNPFSGERENKHSHSRTRHVIIELLNRPNYRTQWRI